MSIKLIKSIIPAKYADYPLIPITVGASGAYVFSSGQKYIVKAAIREGLDTVTWNSFVHEYNFYTKNQSLDIKFIPELEYTDASSNYVLLVMQRYEPLYKKFNLKSDMKLVIELLTDINSFPMENIYPTKIANGDNNTEKEGEKSKSAVCVSGWLEVLGEHGDIFNKDMICEIASDIKAVLEYPVVLPEVLNHGDFHLGNVLIKGGGLAACDWQNIGQGHASGDLSFLLSRANADGFKFNINKIVDEYCTSYSEKSGNMLYPESVYAFMAKSDLGLGFYWWHEYLHGALEDRVKIIYDKMVESYKYLKNHS